MDKQENSTVQMCEEALVALENGQKIEAIKIVRQKNGLELKSAKLFIDDYLRQHPDVDARFQRHSSHKGSVFFFAVCVLLAVIYAGYKGYL